MSIHRYLPAAQSVAKAIPDLLTGQGLVPLISRFVLTETQEGDAWLFIVMDDSIAQFLQSYAAANVLSHLSTALNWHPVLFSNSFGLRYAVLLSPPRNLSETDSLVYHSFVG